MQTLEWTQINQAAIAKALREFVFEETISIEHRGGYYVLNTPNATYTFKGKYGVWGDLRVEIGSILRDGQLATSAPQFIIDTQIYTKMDDIILANFIEEMNNSLWTDLKIKQKLDRTSLSKLLDNELELIQHYVYGHPKIINAKGRLGWSLEDQFNYAPENEVPIQFTWVAVDKSLTTAAVNPQMDWLDIYRESFTEDSLQKLIRENHLDLERYYLLPIHPWQWDRYIYLQFQTEIQSQKIIHLGPAGDFYQPQISLRTFNNVSRPGLCDIKLPLSIANTSSVRGIPARYIEEGPALSHDFEQLCEQDSFLKQRGVKILKEIAGISLVNPHFKQIKDAPYRYQELMGAIWRLSPHQVREPNHSSLMVGSLLAQNDQGTLISELIQRSGVSTQEWLRLYAQHVILPLFHLQVKHGIGLVAHGQNIVLELNNFLPQGLILKDFQGDLRLTEKSQALKQNLTRLPAHYLIHDLVTGHFVTFLRYLSGLLEDTQTLQEKEFYSTLHREISTYIQALGDYKESEEFSAINILSPELPKVLINAVRYKVGYSDSTERPLPMLGTNIKNPLAIVLEK